MMASSMAVMPFVLRLSQDLVPNYVVPPLTCVTSTRTCYRGTGCLLAVIVMLNDMYCTVADMGPCTLLVTPLADWAGQQAIMVMSCMYTTYVKEI